MQELGKRQSEAVKPGRAVSESAVRCAEPRSAATAAEEESAAKALKALPAPPAPLPPLGSQMPGGPPPPVQAHSQQHYMPHPM